MLYCTVLHTVCARVWKLQYCACVSLQFPPTLPLWHTTQYNPEYTNSLHRRLVSGRCKRPTKGTDWKREGDGRDIILADSTEKAHRTPRPMTHKKRCTREFNDASRIAARAAACRRPANRRLQSGLAQRYRKLHVCAKRPYLPSPRRARSRGDEDRTCLALLIRVISPPGQQTFPLLFSTIHTQYSHKPIHSHHTFM
jgi:hypothetical protein